MTVSRIALRLATLEALAPTVSKNLQAWAPSTNYALADQRGNGVSVYKVITAGVSASSGGPTGNGADIVDGTVHWKYAGRVWPTLATAYVFDSKLDPLDDLKADEKRPTAIIYTEDDDGDPAQKAGGPPFKRNVDLVIEIAVVSLLPLDQNNFAAGVPWTDGELEASLDLFEAQIRFALFYGPTGRLWRQLTGSRVPDIHSLPHRTSEEATRLAMRTLRMKVTVPDDAYDGAPGTDPSGNDRLPEPLKTVVAALIAGSYGAKLGAGLAADAPVMPVAVPLETVTFDIQPGSPPAEHDADKRQINSSADNLGDT